MTTDKPPKNQATENTVILVGITGPCGAGKSTLAAGLQRNGYRARAIVQEHSYVKDMWQRLTKPDILIFLQASCTTGAKRRKMNWTESEWEEQQRRLEHARLHADLIVDTDELGSNEVLEVVLEFLRKK
jgi:hypothetical protein